MSTILISHPDMFFGFFRDLCGMRMLASCDEGARYRRNDPLRKKSPSPDVIPLFLLQWVTGFALGKLRKRQKKFRLTRKKKFDIKYLR
jgi:hypothetical protein